MTAQPSGGDLVVGGVRILQVDQPELPLSERVDITVSAGRISRVEPHRGRRDDAVDGEGRIVVPGLVNAHDHLYSKELRDPAPGMDISAMRKAIDTRDEVETVAVMLRNAWRAMAEGVTVIRDLGAKHGVNTRLSALVASGTVPGPDIVAAGRPVVMTGGHVWTFGREADGPDECRRAVREQRKAGAAVIKVMASGGLSNFPHEDYTVCEFTDDELAAIAHEARKLGLPTCAHAFGADAVDACVRAGIDCIEHGVHLDDVEAMVAKGIGYVPTMANMRRIASPDLNVAAGVPERAEQFDRDIVQPQRASVARAVAAGVRIGVGTDSTGTYVEELELLMAAGMSADQVIRAATVDGAGICRVDAGVVAVGRRGSFALHEDDPREDPLRLTRPSSVVVAGRLYRRSDFDALLGWRE
ncbi:MAG TPA: amidohydrolase family protein [Acidimicrobiia bacterium]|nr:amidohydrolase family protein [Acidimicrobiia bacterium]